jgi:hypothetical protein
MHRWVVLVRLVYLAVDPLGSHKIIPYRGSQIIITLSFPFGIASNLLVLFYWQEILSKRNMKVAPFLRRLIAPFIIFVILLFLLDLAGISTSSFPLIFCFIMRVLLNILCFSYDWIGIN